MPKKIKPLLNDSLAREILEAMSLRGESLHYFCRARRMDVSMVFQWLTERHGEAYEMAKRQRAAYLVDEALHVADVDLQGTGADSARVNAAKLKCDTLKWAASKLSPADFGEMGRGHVAKKATKIAIVFPDYCRPPKEAGKAVSVAPLEITLSTESGNLDK